MGGGYSKLFVFGIAFGILLSFANLVDGLISAQLNMLGTVIYAFSVFMWALFAPEIKYKNIIFKIVILIGRKYYVYFYVLQYMTISLVKKCSLCRWALKIYDAFDIEISYLDYVVPFAVVVALFFESVLLDKVFSIFRAHLDKVK